MSLFDENQKRDIREYVFQLDEAKRNKILQIVSILEDEGEDDDMVTSFMYELSKNTDKIDKVFETFSNNSMFAAFAQES